MRAIEKLYQDLEKYKNFDEEGNAEKFLETTDSIILYKDPESIKVILQYFDDNSEYLWVFDSISSGLESYSKENYVSELLKNLPILLKQAPVFADNFFNRIFNSPEYYNFFVNNIHLAHTESLLTLLNIMEEESPHHRKLYKELQKKLFNRKIEQNNNRE